MILVDTSAWVEYLRGTGSPTSDAVDRLLGGDLAITQPVMMEVLAGGRSDRHVRDLRGLLGRAQLIPCASADFFEAAALHRVCRESGETVRRLVDCLIAAVAIRADVPVLHNDSDYEVLARHSTLSIHTALA